MTAIGPYSQSYMMSHMYSIPDLRVSTGKIDYDKSSMIGVLNRTPIYSKFTQILQRAKMDGTYNQPQANFTLFIVSNSNIPDGFVESLDVGDARRIVKSSSFNRIIPSIILEDSPANYFTTTDEITKLFITNLYGETFINNNIKVIAKDISCSNGMMHVVNNVIIPYV